MSVWQTGSGRVAIRGSDAAAAGASAPSADAAFKIALDLHRAGRVSDAVASARQTLQGFPDHVPTLHLLAQMMHRQGHAAIAFETLAKAISIAPDNFSLYNDAGLALSALGYHNEATAYFTRAIELKPAARSALVNRANTYARMQRHAEAIAGYKAALELKPDDGATLTNLASLYEAAGRYKEAAQTVKRAMASAREDPTLNLIAARLERYARQHDKARLRLEAMLKTRPRMAIEAEIIRELGHVDDAGGEYQAALRHYRRANKLMGRVLRTQPARGTLHTHLDAVEQWLAREDDRGGKVDAKTPVDGPVFVIGFPGSGCHTLGAALLRNKLDQVCVERTLWGHQMARFGAADAPLTPALRAELLAPFLLASPPARGPALIEVLALGLLYAPLQCALFTDARFIYVRRDTDDTLLTAATQTYLAPEIAPHMLQPAQTRRLLERFEQCWSGLRERLGPRAHTVNYESLFHTDAKVHTPAWEALSSFLGAPPLQRPPAAPLRADDESRFAPGHARHYASWLR